VRGVVIVAVVTGVTIVAVVGVCCNTIIGIDNDEADGVY
jgi:hypothetical protein